MTADDEGDEPDWGEINPTLVGCSCDHEPEQHGWGTCDVDGCPCEGGWEE